MIKWCNTDVGEPTAQACTTDWLNRTITLFSQVPWLLCTSTRALLENFWWNTVCLCGVSSSHPITLISLFMLPKSPGISCLVTNSCVLRVPSTISLTESQLWEDAGREQQCPPWEGIAVGGRGAAWSRVYFKRHVSGVPADDACWAWGLELLVKPANVWLKAPVRGIHMATTSAAAGAVSKCPLSSAVEFEVGACLTLGLAGNIWRLQQCWSVTVRSVREWNNWLMELFVLKFLRYYSVLKGNFKKGWAGVGEGVCIYSHCPVLCSTCTLKTCTLPGVGTRLALFLYSSLCRGIPFISDWSSSTSLQYNSPHLLTVLTISLCILPFLTANCSTASAWDSVGPQWPQSPKIHL